MDAEAAKLVGAGLAAIGAGMAAIGVGAKPAIPWLIETANKQNTSSKYAANALAKMGKHAESAIPDLEKLANSKNKSIASAAKNAIAKISAD